MEYPLKPPEPLMNDSADNFLTTSQLARMWAVSEATIKRWADAGLLQFRRTVGGHRRFTFEEAERFERERGLGPNSAARGRGPVGAPGGARVVASKGLIQVSGARALARSGEYHDPARTFLDALVGGRDTEASIVLLSAFVDGVAVAEILDEVVAPAMRQIGTLWHGGVLGVSDEHLATRAAVRALESLSSSVRRRHAGPRAAVCCASEGEMHEVAVLGLQVLLESGGWLVKCLGGNTPFFALADAVAKHRPELVCVSSTMSAELERSAREYPQLLAAARGCSARVVLGGAGFRDGAVRRRFPADFHAESFAELEAFLNEAPPDGER